MDSLTFLSVADLDGVFPKSRCAACFDGKYPLEIPTGQRASIQQDRTAGRLRPAVV